MDKSDGLVFFRSFCLGSSYCYGFDSNGFGWIWWDLDVVEAWFPWTLFKIMWDYRRGRAGALMDSEGLGGKGEELGVGKGWIMDNCTV